LKTASKSNVTTSLAKALAFSSDASQANEKAKKLQEGKGAPPLQLMDENAIIAATKALM